MAGLESDRMWTWRRAGINVLNMRVPIALLGAATILVLGLAGYRVFGRRPTLLLCLLMALSPWHLWMSQVGRFYMQLFLLYNLGLLLYFQATQARKLSLAVASMLAIVLAFFTTPIALMILGVFGLDVVVGWLRRRPTRMPVSFWVVGAVGLTVCAAGLLHTFANQAEGYTFVGSPQSIPTMTLGMVYLIGVPVVVTAALGLWCLFANDERLAILLALAAVVPLITFVGFNAVGFDAHVRYTFVGLFAWLALAAVGLEVVITSVKDRWGRFAAALPVLALLSTLALSDYVYMTSGAGYRGRWNHAMTYVAAHRRPGELVGGDLVARWMIQYYLEEPDPLLLSGRDADLSATDLVRGPAWLVYRVDKPSTGDRTHLLPVTGQLEAYFTNQIAGPYQAINVYYYSPPTEPVGAPAVP